MKVKIEELEFDKELYPRLKIDWLTSYQYAQAMRAGAKFPPILVGIYKGKKYVVDGWHRVKALELLGEKEVEAEVKEYEKWEDMFVDGVRLNITHGRQLSPQEKARIVDKLKELNFTPELISQITTIPIDKIERFEIKVLTTITGEKIYLKAPLEKVEKFDVETVKKAQELFNVRTQKHLLTQLLALLESDTLRLDSKEIRELTIKVWELLGEKLKAELVR